MHRLNKMLKKIKSWHDRQLNINNSFSSSTALPFPPFRQGLTL